MDKHSQGSVSGRWMLNAGLFSGPHLALLLIPSDLYCDKDTIRPHISHDEGQLSSFVRTSHVLATTAGSVHWG